MFKISNLADSAHKKELVKLFRKLAEESDRHDFIANKYKNDLMEIIKGVDTAVEKDKEDAEKVLEDIDFLLRKFSKLDPYSFSSTLNIFFENTIQTIYAIKNNVKEENKIYFDAKFIIELFLKQMKSEKSVLNRYLKKRDKILGVSKNSLEFLEQVFNLIFDIENLPENLNEQKNRMLEELNIVCKEVEAKNFVTLEERSIYIDIFEEYLKLVDKLQ